MSRRKGKGPSDTISDDSPDRNSPDSSSSSGIRLKKEVGLFEGVAIIMGIIIGSGKPESNYLLLYYLSKTLN